MGGLSNSEFLDRIYDSALEPALWRPVMEQLADLVGGSGAWLSRLNIEDGSGAGEDDPIARLDPTWPTRYSQHFANLNPLVKVDDPLDYLRRWTPRVLTDEDWMPKADLLRSEYYNDFLRPQDVHSALMIRLGLNGVEVATLNIARPERRGQFARPDIELANWYHPHLIRAFGLGRRMAATHRLGGEMAEVLDHSPHGLFLLDQTGRVRHVNRAGEALLAEPDGLVLVAGRLGAGAPDATRQFQALIAAAGSPEWEQRGGGSMALPTPARRMPLSLTVTRVNSPRLAPLHSGPAVILICVTDLEADISLPEQRLRDLFHLTPAEARLALALFEGLSPARGRRPTSFGVSFQTTRNQLARVYEKTHTRRQAELARLLMRIVGSYR